MTTMTPPPAVFQRLRPGAPLGLRAAACLPLRSRFADCHRCVEVCPVGVLKRADTGFTLADGCIGCGRCAAVCPVGALAVSGFGLGMVYGDDTTEPLAVDCWRVPAAASPDGALRVPCLGGLSVGQLLALRVAAVTRPVELLDRGWCERCPAGRDEDKCHPAGEALREARRWLKQTGVPQAQWPRLARRPLPFETALPTLPDAVANQPVSRRDFFGGFARGLAAAVTDGFTDSASISETPPSARGPLRSLERERQRHALEKLASCHGTDVPARFFPAIEVSAGCRDHRVCAALCPTGALHAYEADGVRGVVFDAAACIACGVCAAACPRRALRVAARAGSPSPVVLTRHVLRLCENCGSEFTGPDDEMLCLPCRKSQQFAKAVLFDRHTD